jgi:hypothetical protein
MVKHDFVFCLGLTRPTALLALFSKMCSTLITNPMKHRLLYLSLALLACCLPSCMGVYSSETPTQYGVAKKQLYTQMGMKVEDAKLPQGGSFAKADGEKNFGQAMTAVGTGIAVNAWSAVEQAKSGAAAATQQTALKTAARVEETTVRTIGSTATTLGSNPEANVGAVDAVGRVFRR